MIHRKESKQEKGVQLVKNTWGKYRLSIRYPAYASDHSGSLPR